jgi:hypothetical protein
MTSFEEYHTAKRRERSWQKVLEEEETDDDDETSSSDHIVVVASSTRSSAEKVTNDNENLKEMNTISPSHVKKAVAVQEESTTKNNNNKSSWSRDTIGTMLETYEVQFGIVALIYFDIIVTLLLYISSTSKGRSAAGSSSSSTSDNNQSDPTFSTEQGLLLLHGGTSLLYQMLTSIQSFTLGCFLLELVSLLYAFSWKFFTHIGYGLDMTIILLIVWESASSSSQVVPLRLLGVMRIWRIARLVTHLTDRLQVPLDQTKSKLLQTREQVSK